MALDRARAAGVLALMLASAGRAGAGDLSSMYDEKTLNRGKERYIVNVQTVMRKTIPPILTEAEKARYTEVNLRFPAYDIAGNPFRFRAVPDREIIVPIFVVRFLDDLAIAGSWLAEHPGKGRLSIEDYVSQLKYRSPQDFPGRRYPTPLAAIGVPDQVLDDKRVDRMAQDLVSSYVVFLLAREVAALYASDPETRVATNQPSPFKTATSDASALEVLRRLGAPPTGLCFYMKAERYYVPNAADIKSLPGTDSLAGPLSKFVQEFSLRQRREVASMLVQGKDDFIRFASDRKAAGAELDRCVKDLTQSEPLPKAERGQGAPTTSGGVRATGP